MKILPSASRMAAAPSRMAAGEDAKVKQPAVARAEPDHVVHKLLNANLELSTEELQRQLADQNDFTVIGVLGCQGAGKSTIMSLLAGANWKPDDREPGQLRNPPFAPQTLETLLQGSHQTVGVDVTVTAARQHSQSTLARSSPRGHPPLQKPTRLLRATLCAREGRPPLRGCRGEAAAALLRCLALRRRLRRL